MVVVVVVVVAAAAVVVVEVVVVVVVVVLILVRLVGTVSVTMSCARLDWYSSFSLSHYDHVAVVLSAFLMCGHDFVMFLHAHKGG